MPFRHDSTGINPDEFPVLDDGYYPFKIVEAEESKSKRTGYDMMVLKCEVSGHSEKCDGMKIMHYVTFIPKGQKGEGMSVHFRKSIGVPFGGNDVVDAQDWLGKRFIGKVTSEVYEGKRRNKIAEVSPVKEDEKVDDPIPF